MVAVLLFCGIVTAQVNKAQKDLKSYIFLSAGPSFPIGDFASTDENNDNAGFAKTGFNLDLAYGYKFNTNIGVEFSALYANHGLSKKLTSMLSGAGVDHFQIIAFMPGVSAFTKSIDKAEFGIRIRGGYATINSPHFVYAGEVLVTEDWADAFIWGGGANLKMDVSKNVFLSVNLDYLQTRPEFKVKDNTTNETIRAIQHMADINLNAGVGIRF